MRDDARVPHVPEHTIASFAGPEAAQQGRTLVREGDVHELTWDVGEGMLTGRIEEPGAEVRTARVELEPVGPEDPDLRGPEPRAWFPIRSRCSCPTGRGCEHTAALLYAVARARASQHDGRDEAAWRELLDPLTEPPDEEEQPRSALAIGVELYAEPLERTKYSWGNEPATAAHVHAGRRLFVGIRPLRAGRRGSWVKSGLSWRTFEFRGMNDQYVTAHADALTQLFSLAESERSYTRGPVEHLWLTSIRTPLIWDSLAAAQDAGVELVPLGALGAVRLADRARVALDLEALPSGGEESGDLEIRVVVTMDGRPTGIARPVGENAVIDVHLPVDAPQRIELALAPADTPMPKQIRTLLSRGTPLIVPAQDTADFFRHGYPGLRRHITVTSTDSSVTLPAIDPATLTLRARYTGGDSLELSWSWTYHDPHRTVPVDRRHGGHRDTDHEDEVLARVRTLWPTAAHTDVETLGDVDTALFSEQVLDELRALPHVRVDVSGTRHRYRELAGSPQVRVTQHSTPGKNDWFELGFEVTLEGRTIPFPQLFTALAEGRSRLLLPDRTYFSLEHESLDALRRLIAEGEALAEWNPEHQQLSRYHLGLWEDITALADEAREAEAFARTVGRLRDLEEIPAPELPDNFADVVRPYQLHGITWLSFLHRHGLGGILADDMGLGKTLQALALITIVRGEGTGEPPFLVVAPSSVLGVWQAEAARFAPGLDLRVVERTVRARSGSLAELARGADVVVTSYTILRIDADEFLDLDWGGLILDEAQFAKNRGTKAHRTARKLRAPFRLAITGTPLENSLSDLWSLLALTVPGLFPSAARFTREFVRPIESGEDPARMERLRHRIRPFVLRRTKEMVAADLPPKQEQVARIPLEPEHRQLYDSVLQRERKKVLGLIDEDMDRSRFIVFRSLTLLRMLALDPAIVDEEYADVASSKMTALMGKLEEVFAEHHRVLIFSQFTSFLRRVGDELMARGVEFSYLDGSTRDRAQVIDDFRGGTDPAFLISLKAGGFGLTLTEADYVFLLDPWWNPAAEAQAVDRTHRIGQTSRVMVYRVVAEETIEEKVLALQEKKAALFDSLTAGGDAFSRALTADDVRDLFGTADGGTADGGTADGG